MKEIQGRQVQVSFSVGFTHPTNQNYKTMLMTKCSVVKFLEE